MFQFLALYLMKNVFNFWSCRTHKLRLSDAFPLPLQLQYLSISAILSITTQTLHHLQLEHAHVGNISAVNKRTAHPNKASNHKRGFFGLEEDPLNKSPARQGTCLNWGK